MSCNAATKYTGLSVALSNGLHFQTDAIQLPAWALRLLDVYEYISNPTAVFIKVSINNYAAVIMPLSKQPYTYCSAC